MIEKTSAFKTSDGQTFELIEEAQKHEIELLFEGTVVSNAIGMSPNSIAALLVERAEEVVDILTTGPNSLPKARKLHGGKKTRIAKGLIASPTT